MPLARHPLGRSNLLEINMEFVLVYRHTPPPGHLSLSG